MRHLDMFDRSLRWTQRLRKMNVTGKLYILLGVFVLSFSVSAQTTNTNCTTQTYESNGQINCTSTTQQAQQQSQAGQQIGSALGTAIGTAIAQHMQQHRAAKKSNSGVYPAAWCAEHAGAYWSGGQCSGSMTDK
jgi:hypothetical protein